MKSATRKKLQDALDYCDRNDKSTEFTIQYLQDQTGVSHDTVMSFLREGSTELWDCISCKTRLPDSDNGVFTCPSCHSHYTIKQLRNYRYRGILPQ